jgi:flagellar basal-body rod protein FlgF
MPGAGIYTSLSGAAANLEQIELIANNIANVSTTGFRRDQLRFDTVLGASLPFARAAGGSIDLSPGTSQLSTSPLHAAIEGDGFFVIQTVDGREQYTRRGDFRLSAGGVLALPNGDPVLGDGGPITIPPGVTAELRPDGTVVADGTAVGKLRVVRFDAPELLGKAGGSAVEAGPGATPTPVENARLAVGFVEDSNVDLSAELVALIVAQRSFEASVNSLRINDELTQNLIQAQR